MKKLFRLLNNEKGQSMVEFALVLPLLLFVVVMIVQGSLYYNAKTTLEYEAREAVRIVALGYENDLTVQNNIINKINSHPYLKNNDNVDVFIDPEINNRVALSTTSVTIVVYGDKFKIPVLNNLPKMYGKATMRMEPTSSSGGDSAEFPDNSLNDFAQLYVVLNNSYNPPAASADPKIYDSKWAQDNKVNLERAVQLYNQLVRKDNKFYEKLPVTTNFTNPKWNTFKNIHNNYL